LSKTKRPVFSSLIVAICVVLCYTTALRLFTFSDHALSFQRFTCHHCLQMQGLMVRVLREIDFLLN